MTAAGRGSVLAVAIALRAESPAAGLQFVTDPLGQIVARRIDAVYAYVPLSVGIGGSRLVMHQNAGRVHGPEPVEVAAGSRARCGDTP
jgi:hypothetical protein